jgi:hypothetical protein
MLQLCAVPYMWSGGPLTGSLELPFTYASDMLPWIALGIDSHHAFTPKGRPPVPSKEDIRQSFEFAQQQPPQEVDTQFGHAAVDALHAEMQKALDLSAGMRESVDTARRIGQSDLGIGFDSEHAVQVRNLALRLTLAACNHSDLNGCAVHVHQS